MNTLLLALFATAFCEQMQWTGTGPNNLWTEPLNWTPFGIPTAQDDVKIPSGNVRIATPAGGTAFSITLTGSSSLSIEGCTVSIGTGGLSVLADASLMVDGSNVVVNGTAIISSTKGLTFKTGSPQGKWVISAGSTANFIAAGNQIHADSIVVGGVLTVVDRVDFYINSLAVSSGGLASFGNAHLSISHLSNNGTVSIKNSVQAYVGESTGSGTLRLYGTHINGLLRNVQIMDSASSLAGSVDTLSICHGCTLAASGTITNVDGDTIMGSNTISLAGRVSLKALKVVLYGSTVNLHGTGSIGLLQIANYGITEIYVYTGSALKVGVFSHQSCELHFRYGSMSPGLLNSTSGTLMVYKDFNLQVQTAYISAEVILFGTITIPAGSTLSAIGNHWAPSAGSTAGQVVNNGKLVIQPSTTTTTFHQLFYSGSGEVEVQGQLDLELMVTSFAKLALASPAARITGESLTLQYTTLTTPKPQQTVNFFGDGKMWTCTSPCSSTKAVSYQSISIWVQG